MVCSERDENCKRKLIAMQLAPKVSCREKTKEVCPFKPEFLMVSKPPPPGKKKTEKTTMK